MLKYFFVFNFLTIPSFAQEVFSNSEDIQSALKNSSYEPNYFSLILGLFIVVGLVYLTGFIYQKLLKINISQNNDNTLNKIDIVSTTALGQGKALHVIKINGEYLLIGACQNNISYLKEIKTQENNKEEKCEKP